MRSAAFLAFFLSGASSLIFQSIWSRMMVHVFGAGSVAISTIVTLFMAGLGLGAWIACRFADRIKHPVMTYGVVEGLVGVFALCVPLLVDPEGWMMGVNRWLHSSFETGSVGMAVMRFFCVAPIVLVPTTLMGTSLPLLSRHFVKRAQSQNEVGSWVGALYSVNTFGAVFGVLLGGFAIMPLAGVSTTNYVAAGINFALCIGIFASRRWLLGDEWKPGDEIGWLPTKKAEVEAEQKADAEESGESESDEEAESGAESEAKSESKATRTKGRKKSGTDDGDDGDDDSAWEGTREEAPIALAPAPIARKVAFLAFALSGLASLCYEVVWSRALAMTIGSSFQAFNLILATFLVGIGGGSAIASGVIAGKRLLSTVGATAIALVFLANAPWGVSQSAITWLAISGAFALPIIIVWAAVRARAANDPMPRTPVKPALVMLVVPVAAAAINAVANLDTGHERLSLIVASVTSCLAGFLALLVSLRRYPVLQLATMPLFIAIAAFTNYAFQDEIPCTFAGLVTTVDNLPESVGIVQFFMFLTVALCTLPATVGMGAMFTLTLRVWTSGGDNVGRDVGNVYAGNTLGSVVGAWLPGFVLMQSLGMERTILVGMMLYLGVSLMLLIVSAADPPKKKADSEGGPYRKKAEGSDEDEDDERDPNKPPGWYEAIIYVLAPLIPALIAGIVLVAWRDDGFLRWNPAKMTLGVFRVSLADDACDWGDADLVYYKDGLTTTVTVERYGRHYALKNNGKVDASNGDDMPTQIMVAAYPLLMHPDGPEGLDVAVVGFGSGVSVGTALKFPVARVDVIELERSIPEASKFFEDVNGLDYVLQDFPYIEMDRLSVVNDDGRNYLASSPDQFDVIISEPSNPWITGVSDLFTTDHFRITKQRLREGGIYCQWVQLYELSPANIKTIYRTFASQFEHVIVFAAEDLSSDTVLIGSDSPLPLDLERITAAYQLPGIAEELERAYIHSPFDVFARTLLANKEEVMSFTQIEHRQRGGEWVAIPDSNNDPDHGCTMPNCYREPVILNTDDNAHIEFAAPQDLIGYQAFEGYLAQIYTESWPYGRLVGGVTGYGEGDEAAEKLAEMALSLIAHGRKPEAAAFITRSQEAGSTPTTRIAAEVLTHLITGEREPPLRVEPPTPGPQLAAREARLLSEGFEIVREAVDRGNYATALGALEEIPAPLRLHSGPGLRLLYGYLLYKTAPTYPSRYREAIDTLEEIIRTEPDYVARHPEIFYYLGRSHDAELNFDKALRNMRLFVEARQALAAEPGEASEGDDADAPTTDTDDSNEDGTSDGDPAGDPEPEDAAPDTGADEATSTD